MEDKIREEIIKLGIGNAIRDLRRKRSLTLARLGELSDLSVGFLSQIENNQVVPPLTTLLSIALALEVGIETFFNHKDRAEKITVTKRDERVSVPRRRAEEVGYNYNALAHKKNGKKMEPFWVEFEPRKKEEMKFFEHLGEEFIYVVEGVIEFRSQDQTYVLEAGDCLYLESDVPHSARGLDPGVSKAIVVVSAK